MLTDVVLASTSEANGKYDYVVCTNKAIDQTSIPEKLLSVIDEKKTAIIIIQNGVGNEEPFRRAFPECSIITCVVCTL